MAIIGNSGSGKSTLARHAAESHGLIPLDLDSVAWQPGMPPTLRPAGEAAADVRVFCDANDHWVVEGCYAGLIEAALAFSPLLLFLEPGVEACLANCRARPWEPHKYPSKRDQDARLDFLLDWVRDYYVRREGDLSMSAHQSLFDRYAGPKRKLTVEVDRAAAADPRFFLA